MSAILFYLSWQAPRPVLRSSLGTLFWPRQPTERWRHSLNQQLYRIRKVLPSCMEADRDFIAIPSLAVSIDAKDAIAADGLDIDSERLVRLALDFPNLWKGRFGRSFEDWLGGIAATLRHTVLRALWSAERDALRMGDWKAVAKACDDILAIDNGEPMAHHDRALAVAVDSSLHAALTLLGRAPRPARRMFRKSFQPLGLASLDRTAFQLRNRGQETAAPQFVGRAAEYAELLSAWSSVKEGGFRLVVVRGEAGIGKTRLAERILRFAALQGGRILPGCAVESEQLLSYAALRECISDIAPAERASIARWAREELSQLIDRFRSKPESDDQRNPSRTAEAFRDLLRHLTERSPVVLFIDDAHWADSGTIALLSSLQRLHPESLLIVLCYSPEYLASPLLLGQSAAQHTTYRVVDVGPFPDVEVQGLFDSIDSNLNCITEPALRNRLQRLVGGRPLLLSELVRALPRKPSHREGVDLVLAPAEFATVLPTRILDFFESQLHSIGPDTQRLLLCLATVGMAVDGRLARRILEISFEHFRSAVSEAVRFRLVRTTGDEVAFTHGIVREAVVRHLNSVEVSQMHEDVARVLQSMRETPAAVIAYHFDRADCKSEAAQAYALAAQDAERRGSLRNSEAHLKRVVELMGATPVGRRAQQERLRLLCRVRDFKEALPVTAVLRPIFCELNDKVGLLRCDLVAFATAYYSGRSGPADALLGRAIDLCSAAQVVNDGIEAAEAVCFAAEAAHDLGDQQFMNTFLPAMRSAGEGFEDSAASAIVLAACANLYLLSVDATVALHIAASASTRARSCTNRSALVRALGAHANALTGLGRFNEARSLLEEAVAIAAKMGMVRDLCGMQTNLGVVLLEQGDPGEARKLLEEAFVFGDQHQRMFLRANLIRCAYEDGDLAAAHDGALELQEENQVLRAPWVDAASLTFLGLCSLESGRMSSAFNYGLRLLELVETIAYAGVDLSFAALFLAAFGREFGRTSRIVPLVERVSKCSFLAASLRARVAQVEILALDVPRVEARIMLEEIECQAKAAGAYAVAARAARALLEIDLRRP